MIYFIGIKGSGMASLAVMMKQLGEDVCGSDLDKHFFTEEELLKNQIPIYSFNKDNIKDGYTVVIGNAFLEDFEEVVAARNNKTCKCYRYHEFLGILVDKYHSVGIAGSHGKTTTTTMTKTLLSHFAPTAYLIGDGQGHLTKDSHYLCVESDEFRRHFLAYHPKEAIITNIEIDHVDYFKDEEDYFSAYQSFADNVKDYLFYNGDDEWCRKLKHHNAYSFGFNENNDYHIKNLKNDSVSSSFDFYYHDTYLASYDLPLVGKHLLYDIMGVLSLGDKLGFDHQMMKEAFEEYRGPKRRYKIEEYHDSVFVDDYAHHPTEVKVTIEASFARYPDREIVAVFKPHRASRVLYFADDFARALSIADHVYLLDFTSIDDKQDGTDIDITYLQKRIPGSVILSEDEEGAKLLSKHKGACFVFMSSKDIYNIAKLTKKYL